MDHRFANWNAINMSEAARSVTIKNVCNAIPIHHMTSFRLSDVTIKKMSSKQQQLWRNKKTCRGNHIITWKQTQKSKEGGLGFRDMHIFNRALLAKSAWKLCFDVESMMAKSLQDKYFKDGDLFNLKKKTNTTWSWRSLSYELEFGLEHPDTRNWIDKHFRSYGFYVKLIEYDEVAENSSRDPPSGDGKNIRFVAEQLLLSDGQMESWREWYQKVEKQIEENGFDEL
ncbi:hypothetical protein C5167_016752 [Papaver somniferum]|nr:hypothetical protein C5167_016752 [Papaver somniferum]